MDRHSYQHIFLIMGIQIQIPKSSKFKNSLLGIGTRAHTLTNGEFENQQGFIWLYTHTSLDIWPLLLKERNNG